MTSLQSSKKNSFSFDPAWKTPWIQDSSFVEKRIPKTPQHIQDLKEELSKKTLQTLETIYALDEKDHNFSNTFKAFDYLQAAFQAAVASIHLVKMLHPQEEMREKALAAEKALHGFSVDHFENNRKIYKIFSNYEKKQGVKGLNKQEKYYLKETLREFRRAGLELEGKDFDTLTSLKKELADLTSDFMRNINEDKSCIQVDLGALQGLSEDFIRQLPKDKDQYIVGCDYPTVFEVMHRCQRQETRKKHSIAFSQRAYPQNRELLLKVIQKRRELAQLIGYENYAQMDLDGQMAQNPEKVKAFAESLLPFLQKKMQKELEELKEEMPPGTSLDERGRFNPWDLNYLVYAAKKRRLDVDEEKISQYFPLEETLQGVFDIYQSFFDLQFTVVSDAKLWHKEAQLVQVEKKQTKELIGFLALDLFPREGKYKHACCSSVIPPIIRESGKADPAFALLIANLTPSTDQKPSLLKHSEVETFFHELGHAIHALLGRAQMPTFAAYNTKMDFVELPSQLLEEWLWDAEILRKLSTHYQTKEPLPHEMIEKKIQAKNFDTGRHYMRQLTFLHLSLALFEKEGEIDVQKEHKKLFEAFFPKVAFMEENHFEASFGHLMGYGAKYYSYLWSKVYALDVFDHIKKEGLLNAKVGKRYMETILEKAGGEDPNDLLVDFLQRKPCQKAFFKDLGLNI